MTKKSKLLVGSIGPVEVGYARVGDLESIEASPGWYAWFYVPGSITGNVFDLHRFSYPYASVEGIFNVDLEGWLSPSPKGAVKLTTDQQDDPEFLRAVRSLILAFTPPLYIGISRNLRQRLRTHRDRLVEAVGSGVHDLQAQHAPSPYSPDTAEESSCFGQRLGTYVNHLKLSYEDLYIKYILTTNVEHLAPAEKLLNRTLTPKFGKR